MAAQIRFSTDILRRLGEELNPNIDQGILELVKNAYDADATVCTVDLSAADLGGSVVIEDDGQGMSLDDILNGWLVLGRSRKRRSRLTRLGRIPAGNKGLGRLAALRLGDKAVLESRQRNKDEIVVTLDWKSFDAEEMVDNVAIPVLSRAGNEVTLKRGSRITISKLRRKISRPEVKRLARAMILLSDPFGDEQSGFSPKLSAPEHDDIAKLVADRYFGEAEYHLRASIKDGWATASVLDWRGEELWRATHADLRPKEVGQPYETVDAEFDFWAFILDASAFTTRAASLGQVREWLQAFGGTHVYWNGLRVAPYGNVDDDWLGINLARARNPQERPSTNNSIGRIKVIDRDGVLEQTTDRGEFVDNDAFRGLRAFAVDCLDWMGSSRHAAAEARRAKARNDDKGNAHNDRKNVEDEIKRSPNSSALETAFARYDQARQTEADHLRREIQLYRTLSTAGITAATFAHESQGSPLKVLYQVSASLRKSTEKLADYETKFRPPLNMLDSSIDSLGVLSATTLRLVDRDKRRVGRVDLRNSLAQVLAGFEPFLSGRDVLVERDFDDEPVYLQGTEAAVESIITNLINNSLAAFERVNVAQRHLRMSAKVEGDSWELRVADNGPGISEVRLSDIWLPGVSSRPGGTGLGLTIVRDAVKDLSGDVAAIANGALGGAELVVRLPILEVRE